MRTSFSPTLEAARRLASRPPASPTNSPFAPAGAPRSCEWPRPAAPAASRAGIWQALRQIQARHA